MSLKMTAVITAYPSLKLFKSGEYFHLASGRLVLEVYVGGQLTRSHIRHRSG